MLLTRTIKREENQLKKRIAAAILMCAVMVLIAAAPLAMAQTHSVLKGPQGPRASAVTWEFVPPPDTYGTWTGHIVNNGLRSLVVDVDDNTTGVPSSVMHQRIRFATYPSNIVDTEKAIMSPNHKYEITVTPNGPRDSTCTVDDVFVPATPPTAVITLTAVDGLSVWVSGAASTDANGSIVAYDWNFGDGAVAAGVDASHNYSIDGTYTISLKVTDNDGMFNTATMPVTVAHKPIPPVAIFTVTMLDWHSVSVDASLSYDPDVQFGPITGYDWSFGDGATATGVTATHSYGAPGVFTITLTVTDHDGLTSLASQSVPVVDTPPVAAFVVVVNGLTVDVNAMASTDDHGIVSYVWNWGDGSAPDTTSGMMATHTYVAPAPAPAPHQVVGAPIAYAPGTPFLVYGITKDAMGVPIAGCVVTITNMRTLEFGTYVSEFDGYYEYDMQIGTTSGVLLGDPIKVDAVSGSMTGTSSGTVSGGPYLNLDIVLSGGVPPFTRNITLTVTDLLGQSSSVSMAVTFYP